MVQAQYISVIIFIDDFMSTEGLTKFYKELGVNLENCESMLATYILKIPTFTRITK